MLTSWSILQITSEHHILTCFTERFIIRYMDHAVTHITGNGNAFLLICFEQSCVICNMNTGRFYLIWLAIILDYVSFNFLLIYHIFCCGNNWMILKNIFQYDIICSMYRYVSSFQHWSAFNKIMFWHERWNSKINTQYGIYRLTQ